MLQENELGCRWVVLRSESEWIDQSDAVKAALEALGMRQKRDRPGHRLRNNFSYAIKKKRIRSRYRNGKKQLHRADVVRWLADHFKDLPVCISLTVTRYLETSPVEGRGCIPDTSIRVVRTLSDGKVELRSTQLDLMVELHNAVTEIDRLNSELKPVRKHSRDCSRNGRMGGRPKKSVAQKCG